MCVFAPGDNIAQGKNKQISTTYRHVGLHAYVSEGRLRGKYMKFEPGTAFPISLHVRPARLISANSDHFVDSQVCACRVVGDAVIPIFSLLTTVDSRYLDLAYLE